MLSAQKVKETLYLSIKEVGQEKIKKRLLQTLDHHENILNPY
jgi:hypothetical protein